LIQLTRAAEYAVRGVLCLARSNGFKWVLLEEIARRAQAPEKFMAKIFQSLVHAGIVESARGAGGGFRLAKPAGTVSVLDVIQAVEGPVELSFCRRCNMSASCPICGTWGDARDALVEALDDRSFADFATSTKGG